MRISSGRVLVLPLLAALAGGCLATGESCVRTLELYLNATEFTALKGKAEPAPESMAGRILAARRTSGWEAGFRVLDRDLQVMVQRLESAGNLPEEWRAQLQAVGEILRLPEPVHAALGAALGAAPEKKRSHFEALREALEDFLDGVPDAMDRLDAVTGTAWTGETAAAPLLVRLFEKEPVGLVRGACLGALISLGADEAAGAALGGLADSESVVRVEALKVVRRLEIRSARKTVTAMLRSPREPVEVRREAAKALRSIGTLDTVPPLIEALSELEHESVRIQAARALEEITSQDFGLRPLSWDRWWKENRSGRIR
jgi:hypothetical protein